MGHIYTLEFGGQHTDLIGNRLEEMGFSIRYAPSDVKISGLDASGIIISGGPKSVNDADKYPHDPNLFKMQMPILGICYGMQLLGKNLGAEIHKKTREYGETRLRIHSNGAIFHGLGDEEIVWMNHGDSITTNSNFAVLAYTEKGVPAAIKSGNRYGVQFHPEVTHTENGKIILRNFAQNICGCVPAERRDEFDADKFIEESINYLREEVGGKTALVYTSGGVDSSVAAYLAKLAGLKIQPVYLEMGNGRKNEAQNVSRILGSLLGTEIYILDASSAFVDRLQGICEPEPKRRLFSRLYADTRKELEDEFSLDDCILIQGTIATDRRETGKEAGKKGVPEGNTVATIKTHHNVGAEDSWKGISVLPLRELTKDRVRLVARKLGLPKEISERQPFPGPGLFLRFVTGFYEYEDSLASDVSDIASQYQLKGYVLPRKGVGLKGDERAFEHAALLTGERDWKNIRKAGKQILEDLDISRALYLPAEKRLSQ
ncbi:MAG: gamma-glutamyl-gamma-aminobutyrate hydrolase family protein, partial [Candidatus Aenigmarchaeota archaeon]|nr:gamma-glutamyl-gamma-aminobutyrate hydrolase family protein [Candidatus Aenigmarchaeota archaeon]